MADDNPEVTSLQAAIGELLDALRRSQTQSERLLERAISGPPLTSHEVHGVRAEIATTRAQIEQLEAMLTLR